MEILVIQTAFPGDLFLSIPLLKQTRLLFPDSKISLLCRQGLGSVFVNEKLVDQVFEIEKGSAASYQEALKKLKAIRFDFVISPHQSFRTAVLVRGLNKSMAVGFKRWWNFLFFDKTLSYPRHLPDAFRQMSLLTLIHKQFSEKWKPEDLRGHKNVSPLKYDVKAIPEWASMETRPWTPQKKIIYVAPGSVWNTKKWKIEHFEELIQKILQQGYEVALTGSKADQEACDALASQDPRIQNLCGKTNLKEILDRFQEAQALVANDSGAIHMAATVGLPTVAIFGPTVPEFGFRPWNNRAVVVQHKKLDCRPCSAHGTAKCPIRTHECMKGLSVDEVFHALTDLIQEFNRPHSPAH